eukprot:6294839-Amphidinium_carterae.1
MIHPSQPSSTSMFSASRNHAVIEYEMPPHVGTCAPLHNWSPGSGSIHRFRHCTSPHAAFHSMLCLHTLSVAYLLDACVSVCARACVCDCNGQFALVLRCFVQFGMRPDLCTRTQQIGHQRCDGTLLFNFASPSWAQPTY